MDTVLRDTTMRQDRDNWMFRLEDFFFFLTVIIVAISDNYENAEN